MRSVPKKRRTRSQPPRQKGGAATLSERIKGCQNTVSAALNEIRFHIRRHEASMNPLLKQLAIAVYPLVVFFCNVVVML